MSGKNFELNNSNFLPIVNNLGRYMPGGLFIYKADETEELIYANEKVYEIFGCKNEDEFKQLTGYTFRGMIHPDDYEDTVESINKQISSSDEKMDYVEYRIIRKDGKIRWVDDYGHYEYTEQYGGIYYVFISDITHKKEKQELEQRLKLQEQLIEEQKRREEQDKMITALASDYRSVYHVDLDENDAVCYRADPDDRDQRPVGVHFPYLERFQYYANTYVDSMYRESFLKFIEPDNIRKELEKNLIIAYRYLVHRCGRSYYEMIRMAGVRHAADRDDHIVHAIGLGLTVIDKEMRESMAKNHALAEALTAAQEANKAKTAFLSNMSHEIRTPMNAIIGLDNLALRDKNISPHTRKYLEKIDSSARHLLGLINDILDMSRIESGKMILRKEDFSFRTMLEQINTMVISQCEEKGLKYECQITGGISDYYIGDVMKLKQVLINILSNAIKFTEAPGNILMTIERTHTYNNQSTIRFIIKDTGIGMSKSFVPKLFDLFTQEDMSKENKNGSTGLGMAITKNIVDLMNGSISVKSEKGAGTEFTVVTTLGNSDHHGYAVNRVTPKDIRVLVVDDEEVAAEHAKIVLEEAGIHADICFDGETALRMMQMQHGKHQSYNLVLVDWKMPGMNGMELSKK